MVEGATLSFDCTACGKCCNSPPLMTVPELFRHADRFIGALALRRIRAPVAGTRHAVAGRVVTVGKEDVEEFHAIARRQGHALPGGEYLILMTQAIDYPSAGRCPALADDNGCAIHADRPATCAMVPLDAWVPDGLQQVALAAKQPGGAQYLGADCITAGAIRPLVQAREVVDAGYRAALARRREAEAEDKRDWGDAVCRLLLPELLGPRGDLAAIPPDGQRTLSLAPVLAVLAASGAEARARCLIYIGAQRAGIAAAVGRALARRQPADKPTTALLRSFDTALATLASRLGQP